MISDVAFSEDGANLDPLHIPERVIPKNMEYGWVSPEHSKFEYAQTKGWKEVPSERHPEFSALQEEHEKTFYVSCKGLILCEREKSIRQEEMDLEVQLQKERLKNTVRRFNSLCYAFDFSPLPDYYHPFARINDIYSLTFQAPIKDLKIDPPIGD